MKFGEVMKKKLHSFPSTGDTPGRERGCAAGARGEGATVLARWSGRAGTICYAIYGWPAGVEPMKLCSGM